MQQRELMSNGEQRGHHLLATLKNPRNLEGAVTHSRTGMSLTDEYGETVLYEAFVTFPHELSGLFPGSVITPGSFLRELGENRQRAGELLGKGKEGEVAFVHEERGGMFGISILHGSSGSYPLELMMLAREGFQGEAVRARYQHALTKGIAPALQREQVAPYGVRIHDDCLASGDSVLSYLEWQTQEGNGPILQKGVEVVIDGPATAQGALLLRAYAHKHAIPLHITAGYMAYGLSEGVIGENGTRKHANYITMPEQVLQHIFLPRQSAMRNMIGEDGVLYVVGDMGDAERGVPADVVVKLREETGNPQFCAVNDVRRDPHGSHPFSGTIARMDGPPNPEVPNDVYFARGGYVPFALDELHYPHFAQVNKIVLRGSRVWTKELGYGATFRPID